MDNRFNFIGRENEFAALKYAVEHGVKGAIVYGPRQVGKTTLIRQLALLDNVMYLEYQCVSLKLDANVAMMAKQFARITGLASFRNITDIFELFDALGQFFPAKRIVVLIDEYQWVREKEPERYVDSCLKKVIDTMPDNIMIILCGSAVRVMQEIIRDYENPLTGRLKCRLEVKPFNYLQASAFYPSLSVRDKINFYCVFGGYPFVLSMIDETKSLVENIKYVLMTKGANATGVIETIVLGQSTTIGVPSALTESVGNGKVRYSDIKSHLPHANDTTLTRMIGDLVDIGVLKRTAPLNRKDDKKKTFYELSDNLFRFYFSYVAPCTAQIEIMGPDAYLASINKQIDTYISYRFEGIVREYVSEIVGSETGEVGPYWYDNPEAKENGEFDCAERLKDGSWRIYEAKYLKDPMTFATRNDELSKIRKIAGISVSSVAFVSSSGFAFPTADLAEIYITGEDLYRKAQTR